MKIDLTKLGEAVEHLEGSLDAHDFPLPTGEVIEWKRIDYAFDLKKIGDELLVRGTLKTSLDACCARCADKLPWTIEVKDFCESFEIKTLESIDLTDNIVEYILLNLPIAPSCELDSQQKCPLTGDDYSATDERYAELNRQAIWGELDKLKKE